MGEKAKNKIKNNVKTWDATNSMAGLQMNAHARATQGSFSVSTQSMGEMQKRQTDRVTVFVCSLARGKILQHILRKKKYPDLTRRDLNMELQTAGD